MPSASQNRVLFVARHYVGTYRDNLSTKFEGQVSGLRETGREVDHFEISQDGILLRGKDATGKSSAIRIAGAANPSGTLQKLRHYNQIFRAAKKQLARQEYGLVYLRSAPPTIAYLRLLHAAKRQGVRVVVEIPTYPSVGEISSNTWLRRQALRVSELAKRLEAKSVDLYAVIGENVDGTLRGRPAKNINNGVNVPAVAQRIPAGRIPEVDTEVNVIALASMCKWHGYDRLIRGMAQVEKRERPTVHFVGPDGDGSLRAWELLAKELQVGESIIFHGRLDGEELRLLINRCHGAIGSLALHRIGLHSASTLKAREYMARGIPFIYATVDPTLTSDARGALQVPADETPISIRDVTKFFKKMTSVPNLPDEMRQYAQQELSWASNFDDLLVGS